MCGIPYLLGIFLIVFSKTADSVKFQQVPSMIVNQIAIVKLQCSHDDNSLTVMLWYRQETASTTLTLIGYGYTAGTPTIETGFTDQFKMTSQNTTSGELIISDVKPSDSAVYFCAASLGANTPAYFGAGTKLTVLDPKITPSKPTVRILKPILNEECRKETVTVVCVADNFYPDHVKVSWTVGGVVRTDGVATDSAATQNSENKYNITSRLSISYKEWIKEAEINCTVTYTDPETNNQTSVTEYIKGPKRVDSEEEAEKYVPRGKTMLLAYGAFIIKGFLYGLFIMVVIRRQGFMSK
ncbi:immunoglobulin lambda-1 light chain-like isoform X1 [Pygocentrus nattereri]|uniref:immunoglobulin lambda-1 light chain-like isoform X1 n=1 Tax=Pygocentrus nattereri TaxID=42514 RepID=UPI0018914B7E|nr:immunoglobulin lambda-1 light chain-like isoform X1 [Pygocentrus nattereri]